MRAFNDSRPVMRTGLALPAQLVVFALVGIGNALVDAAVFMVLVRSLTLSDGLPATVASTIGFGTGALHSYLWNSRVTFRTGAHQRGALTRFVVVTLLAAAASALAFAIVHAYWPASDTQLVAAKGAAMVVGAIANFALMRSWAFAPRDDSESTGSQETARTPRVHPLLAVLAIALVIRLPFLAVPGFSWDIFLFSQWANTAVEHGLANAMLRPDMDYVGYNYVLLVLGTLYAEATHVNDLAASWGFGQTLKIVPLLGDLGVAALLYFVGQRWGEIVTEPRWLARISWLSSLTSGERLGVAAAALFALNPATLYDSAYWGQVDSVITAAMLGALLLMVTRHPGWAGVVLALGFLVKPQPVLLVPLVGWSVLWLNGVAGLVRGAIGGLVMLAAGLAYFWVAGIGDHILEIYRHLFETGDQVSVSAWNMWWIAYRQRGNIAPWDVVLELGSMGVTIGQLSKVLLGGAVALALVSTGPKPTMHRVLLAAAFLTFAFFMLTMKMHERYLFPALALLAPVAILDRRWPALHVALSVTFLLNLYDVYPMPPPAVVGDYHYIGAPADIWLSALNCGLFLAFALALGTAVPSAWSGFRIPRPQLRQARRLGLGRS
ncbi:MAG: DUF2029 domain-containing protein [Chloroflexi bacterium]|nr:MAG: DUF2029 domain-containing protein [Chloroflexota bacterium]